MTPDSYGPAALAPPAVVIFAPVTERPALSSVLTPDEVDLMARYVGSSLTQGQIAAQDRVPRTTVESRIHKAAAKLKLAGLPLSLPKRGRRPRIRGGSVDPRALDCLVGDEDGRGAMRWRKGKKIDDPDAGDHQW